jgi:hypothetical protein
MKLHSFADEVTVTQSHNQSVGCRSRDLEHSGHTRALDDQRMIAGRREGIIKAAEHCAPIVQYLACLAVHQIRRPDYIASKSLADGLVAETYAKEWHLTRKMMNDVQ